MKYWGMRIAVFAACAALVWAAAHIPQLQAATPAKGAAAGITIEAVQALPESGGLRLGITLRNAGPEGRYRIDSSLMEMNGTAVGQGTGRTEVPPGTSRHWVHLDTRVEPGQIPQLVLHLAVTGSRGASITAARNLIDAVPQLETRVVAFPDLLAGSTAALRVAAVNHATQEPVANARGEIAFIPDGGGEHVLYTGTTGPDGALDARFTVPSDLTGSGDLRIRVAADSLGADELHQAATVRRDTKILLTTDKPLYQPGQNIQMRALCLDAATRKPAGNAPLLVEISDGKGNKVFKKTVDTDEFGVASAAFQLATEVNLGAYVIRAALGESSSEKQVTVDKYVLPKFKVEVTTDRDYYLPGDTLKGGVQADYFFGKPVAGARVRIVGAKFEAGFTDFGQVEGRLDENGHWAFELPLPGYFAGTPIEQGNASVRLVAEVVDTADHREEKVAMKPVAAAPLVLHVVPEGGKLAPGLENRVHVLAAHPDGSPAAGAAITAAAPGSWQVETNADDLGIATLIMPPGQSQLELRARDTQGRSAQTTVNLEQDGGDVGLLLRTEQTLYTVGDTIRATALSSRSTGTVYFDAVRNGQTVMTRTAELENGAAAIELPADAAMAGSVVLQAYIFTSTTDIVRDTRLLYVDPADALNIAVALDRETYQPGEEAQLTFTVTGEQGQPTAAALGLAIVDESVFALQEIHPGLEKVYFMLEQEIMKPRYEIHGFDIDHLISRPVPMPEPGPIVPLAWSDTQQRAAEVLLASAPEPAAPPVRLNSFIEKRKAADAAIIQAYQDDFEHIHQAIVRYLERNRGRVTGDLVRALLRRQDLRPNDLLDPWGNEYELDLSRVEDWGGYFTMLSYGPDGVKGTADDISPDSDWGRDRLGFARQIVRGRADGGGLGGGGGFGGGGFGGQLMPMRFNAEKGAMEALPPPPAALAMPMAEMAADGVANAPGAGGAGPQVRIREYFPETLLFEPALIAGADGTASLTVPLADSITTWRMTAMASSAQGALGSKDAPLRVFQDFFVDLDLPVALTQNDRVSIPVAVYNYLDTAQDVRLKLETADWFTLDGEAERTVRLGPEEVRAEYFPIEVKRLGHHRLTVFAYGSKLNDAIRREIEVLPDGEEQLISFSGRLNASKEHTVEIPANAIDGASKILVRVYPGVFSQIVDGLDSMLQMPFGCFEQTSSVTYPNILIMQYLRATEQINPEIQMTAEGYINAGYQRLLTYEVDGGGFSWFGDAPANKVLTAWGLMEFQDMSQVHEVDPALISRTQDWLAQQQDSDGAWAPDANYLHAESWGNIQNSKLLVTAYIAQAMLSTGDRSAAIERGVQYVRSNWKDSNDPYTLALVANALVLWDKDAPDAEQALARLNGLRKEQGETAWWESGAETVTFAHGDSADVETTGLAAIAFLRSGRYGETATKALNYLVEMKGAQGHWGSTQATILALKAMTEALGNRTEQVNASITVAVNGEAAEPIAITPADSDVMRLLDLGPKTQPGVNTVSLTLAGEGSMMYQVVGRYYAPWDVRPRPAEALGIRVEYDRTELAVNDLITARVEVRNLQPAAAQMVVVDLGIPPGFDVEAADLQQLVTDGVIEKYELTGRQIILYFERLDGNSQVQFRFGLRARFPLRAQTPPSRVYAYYNPEVTAVAAPTELVVQ